MVNRNLFVGTPARSADYEGGGQMTVASSAPKVLGTIGTVAAGAKQFYDSLPPEMQAQAGNYARKTAGDFANKARNPRNSTNRGGKGPTNRGGNGGGNNNNNNNSGNMNTSYALSKAPNPSTVSLNSGLKVNAYVSDTIDTQEDKCSPLHITCVKLQFPTGAADALYNYWNTVVGFDIQSKAQAIINFNLKVGTDFSTDKILTAMNAAMNAAQIYYAYTSILTYHSDPGNRNEGMIYLRKAFGPQTLENLSILGRRLADTPIPPNLFEFIRFINSNYFSGDNQGAPMIKLWPGTFNNLTSALINDSDISAATNALNTSVNNEVFSLIRRVVPAWRPNVLRDVPVNPAYDANFATLFINAPFSTNGIAGKYTYPYVLTTDETISYNSYTAYLDGLIWACTSMYVNSITANAPALMVAVAVGGVTNSENRASYYEVGGVKKLYKSNAYPFLIRSRNDSYVSNDAGTAVLTPHIYGTDKVKGVSSDTVRETANAAMDYLMSLDTIKKSGGTYDFNPASKNKRNYRN